MKRGEEERRTWKGATSALSSSRTHVFPILFLFENDPRSGTKKCDRRGESLTGFLHVLFSRLLQGKLGIEEEEEETKL